MISGLQKEILCLALERKFITCDEILTELWGWQPGAWGSKRATVGEAAYKSGHSSLSRCLTRLWSKNLVRIWKSITGPGTGVSLTPEGQELIQAILGETEDT